MAAAGITNNTSPQLVLYPAARSERYFYSIRKSLTPKPMNYYQILDALTQEGVLINVSVRFWRATRKLKAEDLGLNPNNITNRLIKLGHKKLLPKEALQTFALIESRAHSLVEASTFPFLNGLGHFLPNRKLEEVTGQLRQLEAEFTQARSEFLGRYEELRRQAMADWREAAQKLVADPDRLVNTIAAAFPARPRLERRFGFDTQLFHVTLPERLELSLVNLRDQQEIIAARETAAREASAKMAQELDRFVSDCVVSLREQTARLCEEMLESIQQSKTGVHQKTLNRLVRFIDQFKQLNFVGDQQMEEQLERVRQELLLRSAQEYRDSEFARAQLQQGLSRLAESARNLAQQDNAELVSQFGELGRRRIWKAA